MKCKKCGAETKEGSKFCMVCGAKIEETEKNNSGGEGGSTSENHDEKKMVIRYWKNRKDNNRSIISYFCDHVNRCFLWGF